MVNTERKTYKLMLLGASGVGKTSLARRLKFNAFETAHKSTVGVELYSIDLVTSNGRCVTVLWDTDGHFGDKIFEKVFLKGADGALVVSDSANESTIDHMRNTSAIFQNRFPDVPVASLLNKSDLRSLSEAECLLLANDCPLLHRCSAKTGDGVLDAVQLLVSRIEALG